MPAMARKGAAASEMLCTAVQSSPDKINYMKGVLALQIQTAAAA